MITFSLLLHDTRITKTPCSRKWMISMGAYEGYITIATYDKQYVDFLYDDSSNGNDSFMVMEE